VSAPGQAAARPESAWRSWAVRGALMAQLRAAGRFAPRLRQVAVQRSAPECPAAYPPHRPREVSPETELDSMVLRRRAAALDSAAQPRAGSALRKVVVLLPLAERPAAALESVLLQAASAPQVLVWCRAAVRQMARPSAEFAARARRLAGPVVSAG